MGMSFLNGSHQMETGTIKPQNNAPKWSAPLRVVWSAAWREFGFPFKIAPHRNRLADEHRHDPFTQSRSIRG